MSTFLQIFGSLASIGAIPLAVYLYLRNREAKFFKLRQEICRILSYQIGEGRNLSTFEVQAVIGSKTREHRFKPDTVNSDETIEDLIVETITNPMLESGKKESIIENLQNIHRAGQIHRIVMRYSISTINLLESISHTLSLTPTDSELVKAKEVPAEVKEVIYKRRTEFAEKLSSSFALTAIIIATITLVVGEVSIAKLVDFFSESPYIANFLIGTVVSIIAGFLVYFFTYAGRKKKKKKESVSIEQKVKSHKRE